ncbi:MAG: N-succinylarginine dihydrolase [Desulfomonilaceae bacterium]|nr:N-succinylarginine dihydrolase [Desulfomonilaceae bacterium]
METFELNFDGLVGPTHNYAGLSYGNIASVRHARSVSNPKAAAHQGLAKMKLLADLGVSQAVLPPQERPDMETLKRLGFSGSEASILERAAKEAPELSAACYSASSMWAANAATVSPSADAEDGLVHITPANLVRNFHRSLETGFTASVLKTIFHDDSVFIHHDPVPGAVQLSDEGAANHIRLCPTHRDKGIQVFVYGRKAFDPLDRGPEKYPGRQTFEASAAIARLHRLRPTCALFVRQSSEAIDSGVFHNDVISVGNENLFLYHSRAFSHGQADVDRIAEAYRACRHDDPILFEVTRNELPLSDAVGSYLFNSQIVTMSNRSMCLIAPVECLENAAAAAVVDRLLSEANPIAEVRYVDLRQSIQNGGGPACLRLRVALTERERSLIHQGVWLTEQLYDDLTSWVDRFYRDRLGPEDLADPRLPDESRSALDELTRILGLGSIYGFQKI